jgi:hypothetical protein
LLLAFPLLTIIHEGLFFYLQFFFIPLLFEKSEQKNYFAFWIPYLITACILIVIYLLFKGDITYANVICSSLMDQDISPTICNGAIKSINSTGVYFNPLYFQIYIPIFLLTVTPITLYFFLTSASPKPLDVITLFICFIPTIPLYLISFDWGRWIHIYGLLSLSLFIAIKAHKPQLNFISSFALIPTGFLYIFSWVIPHSIVGLSMFKWFQLPSFSLHHPYLNNLWIFISF